MLDLHIIVLGKDERVRAHERRVCDVILAEQPTSGLWLVEKSTLGYKSVFKPGAVLSDIGEALLRENARIDAAKVVDLHRGGGFVDDPDYDGPRGGRRA